MAATLESINLHYITLHYITLHYITLHYITINITATEVCFLCSCFVWTPLQLKSTSGTHISYENHLTTATEVYFWRPHFIWTPPFCFVGHSISRRVRFAGSRGSVKPAFCQSRRGKLVIPEQFTVKTHPVSVGWRRGVNNGAHLFQSAVDIDIQNTHKTRKNAWNV